MKRPLVKVMWSLAVGAISFIAAVLCSGDHWIGVMVCVGVANVLGYTEGIGECDE